MLIEGVELHAAWLIAISVVSLVTLVAARRRVPTVRQVVLGGLLSLGIVGIGVSFQHLCGAGNPRLQWLIPSVCVFPIASLVDRRRLRRTLIATWFVAAILLSWHFNQLVHRSPWTGNPDWPIRNQRMAANSRLQNIQDVLTKEHADDPTVYPAGWVDESPVATLLESVDRLTPPPRVEVSRAWHTWFTDLYRTTSFPQAFWFPGGVASDAAKRITVKDRPDEPES